MGDNKFDKIAASELEVKANFFYILIKIIVNLLSLLSIFLHINIKFSTCKPFC